MATVSVIVPVSNAEGYLSKCMESLKNQSFSDIKIICVENGSTDNSWNEIISHKKDKRVTAVKVPYAEVSYARNLGLFWALKFSPFVMFCDADDTYDKYMVETMVGGIQESGADLGCCEIVVDYESDNELRESDNAYYSLKFEGFYDNIKSVINGMDYSLCNKIFRTSIIKKYSITFPTSYLYEDTCFCWKYLSVSDSAFFVRKKLYHYLRHDNSIMNKTFAKENKSIEHMTIAANVFDFLFQHQRYEKFLGEFWDFYDSCVEFAKKFGKEEDSLKIEQVDNRLREKFLEKHRSLGIPN